MACGWRTARASASWLRRYEYAVPNAVFHIAVPVGGEARSPPIGAEPGVVLPLSPTLSSIAAPFHWAECPVIGQGRPLW